MRSSLPAAIALSALLLATLSPLGPAAGGPAAQRFAIVPAESQVIYRVAETLFNEGNRLNVAVGTTDSIRGEIIINPADPRQSRLAEFTPTEITGLPATYEERRELRLEITGRLKVRDVTRPVTFQTVLTLNGTTLLGIATTKILMTDFGFQAPSILGILRAENEVNLEFRFIARPPS